MLNLKIIILLVLFTSIMSVYGQKKNFIVVDKNGEGDYATLTEAINLLPMFNYERVTIFIKKGIYEEKIRFDQDYITLEGEDRDSTVIKFNQLREDWVKDKDAIGPAVININGDDIIIKNLTVINGQPETGPHAFALYGTGTRTILLNCSFISKGADTVSLWDYKSGMYYHSDCYFEGAVDFVCPRGWCFIKDSRFYEVKRSAAIWHAGGYEKDQKFVLRNCYFDGVEGFKLGRHHYESQFYLIGCSFSEALSDNPIYRVTYEDSTRNRPFNWGKRYYFSNVSKKGVQFDWMKNNMDQSLAEIIDAKWTFDNRWDPESHDGPLIYDYIIYNNEVLIKFDENVTVYGKPVLAAEDFYLQYVSGSGSNTLKFISDREISKEKIYELQIQNDSKIIGTKASVTERPASFIVLKK